MLLHPNLITNLKGMERQLFASHLSKRRTVKHFAAMVTVLPAADMSTAKVNHF